eukprot:scaffold73_cov131-Skeletonema_dohrnii-CCMP3373.AAC.1
MNELAFLASHKTGSLLATATNTQHPGCENNALNENTTTRTGTACPARGEEGREMRWDSGRLTFQRLLFFSSCDEPKERRNS